MCVCDLSDRWADSSARPLVPASPFPDNFVFHKTSLIIVMVCFFWNGLYGKGMQREPEERVTSNYAVRRHQLRADASK
eukprot:gene31272-8779_t